MKTDRNKKLGRESLDRAKALLSMSDKDREWKPGHFMAKDEINKPHKEWNYKERVMAERAQFTVDCFLVNMMINATQ